MDANHANIAEIRNGYLIAETISSTPGQCEPAIAQVMDQVWIISLHFIPIPHAMVHLPLSAQRILSSLNDYPFTLVHHTPMEDLLTRDLTIQYGAALRELLAYLPAAVSGPCFLPIRVVLLQPLWASPMRIHHPNVPPLLPALWRDHAGPILC
jgi:hypothetical protein